ncbi:unnamed protein product [Dovyalis caffra]|uniref:Uncharacterized protein n=1 Tax=Dovyalis caffra TaxID=77055 RepID=A0AAV1R8F2_9ROSI|nr:unnamed protein product [Dovyalis caffra]
MCGLSARSQAMTPIKLKNFCWRAEAVVPTPTDEALENRIPHLKDDGLRPRVFQNLKRKWPSVPTRHKGEEAAQRDLSLFNDSGSRRNGQGPLRSPNRRCKRKERQKKALFLLVVLVLVSQPATSQRLRFESGRILAWKGILLERLLAYCCLTTSLTLAAQAYLLITDPLPYLLAFPNERTKNLGADWASRTKGKLRLRLRTRTDLIGYAFPSDFPERVGDAGYMPASLNLLLITLRLFSAPSRYKVDFLSYGLSPRTRTNSLSRLPEVERKAELKASDPQFRSPVIANSLSTEAKVRLEGDGSLCSRFRDHGLFDYAPANGSSEASTKKVLKNVRRKMMTDNQNLAQSQLRRSRGLSDKMLHRIGARRKVESEKYSSGKEISTLFFGSGTIEPEQLRLKLVLREDGANSGVQQLVSSQIQKGDGMPPAKLEIVEESQVSLEGGARAKLISSMKTSSPA